MANYAEIDQSGTVLRVIVVSNTDEDSLGGSEAAVAGWLANDLGLGGTWKKTSYNTRKNVHTKGGQPLRKNFAGIGYKYDSVLDAFIPPKPYDSWVLNENEGVWAPPPGKETPPLELGDSYEWDEANKQWKARTA